MKNFSSLVEASRSFRRFDGQSPVTHQQLKDIASLIRYVPSATNKQALKVFLSADSETNGKIFPLLGWAALVSNWGGPRRGERPTGYILVLCDTSISKPQSRQIDLGIAAQTMALAAVDIGLGMCIMGAFPKADMAIALDIPINLEPMLVLAVGKPVEKVVITETGPDSNTAYYRDRSGTHFVPKRPLADFFVTF